MVKMRSIKPVSDPAIKALTADQMITAVKNGKGKNKAGHETHQRPDQGHCGFLSWIELAARRPGNAGRSFI
jgi:hypothetical protein